MTGGVRLLLGYETEPTHRRVPYDSSRREVTVLPGSGVQTLCARQRHRLDPDAPLSEHLTMTWSTHV